MQKLRERLSFANVISVIALFVALGGTGLAASQLGKNTVGTKQLRRNAVTTAKINDQAVTAAKVQNGSLTGADIDVGTLNGVPSAKRADSAARAVSAEHADSADSVMTAARAVSAAHADSADSAAHADSADSATTAANLQAPEAMHVVGTAGEPPFVAGWENALASSERAAFFIDREGVVHLQGRVHRATGGSLVAFALPASYAPADDQTFPARADSGLVSIVVTADGGVGATDFIETDDIFLNGISWRAGH